MLMSTALAPAASQSARNTSSVTLSLNPATNSFRESSWLMASINLEMVSMGGGADRDVINRRLSIRLSRLRHMVRAR
jgi:hypothetical protein